MLLGTCCVPGLLGQNPGLGRSADLSERLEGVAGLVE